jgi:hypothetical protein
VGAALSVQPYHFYQRPLLVSTGSRLHRPTGRGVCGTGMDAEGDDTLRNIEVRGARSVCARMVSLYKFLCVGSDDKFWHGGGGAAGAADAQAGRAAVRELVHGTERLLALHHLPASWLGKTEPFGGDEADLTQRLAAAEAECGAQLDALRKVVDALPHEVVSHAAGRRPSRRRRRSISSSSSSSSTTTITTTTSTAGSACTATRAMPVSWACQANPSSAHVFIAGGRLFYGSRPRQPWCRHHSRSSSQRSLPSATVCARCAHVVAGYPPCAVTLVVLPRSASG